MAFDLISSPKFGSACCGKTYQSTKSEYIPCNISNACYGYHCVTGKLLS